MFELTKLIFINIHFFSIIYHKLIFSNLSNSLILYINYISWLSKLTKIFILKELLYMNLLYNYLLNYYEMFLFK